MKFKLEYRNKSSEIYSKIKLFIAFFIIDIAFTLPMNFVFILPVMFIVSKIYTLFTGEIEVPESISNTALIILLIIELAVIIAVEIKRRNQYVRLDYRGVYICNNNGVRFQPKQWYKINATISFYDIVDCYSMKPSNVPKNYRYQYIAPIKDTARHLGLSNKPYYIPAIANGRYNEECVLLELKNGKTIVLPIDNCDDFISAYNELAEKYVSK